MPESSSERRLAFISYSSKDRDFVLQLAERLKKEGIPLWLDRWNIVGRDPFWDEIQEGIESCTHFVFIISPDAIGKDSGAYTELLHVASLRPQPVIIPVMARETPYDKLPIIITPGKYQIHDFVRFPYEETMPRVVSALMRDDSGTAPIEKLIRSELESKPAIKSERFSCSVRTFGIALSVVVPALAVAFVVILSNQGNPTVVGPRGTPTSSMAIAEATAITCYGTLEPRLVARQLGRVLPGPANYLNDRPQRLSTGAVYLASMPAGSTFIVIEGPVCADGIVWWKVRFGDKIGWTGESDSKGYWIEPIKP